MAKLDCSITFLALFVAAGLLFVPALSEDIAPSPKSEHHIVDEEFFQTCVQKVNGRCSIEVLGYLLALKNQLNVSRDCCLKIIESGIDCHHILVDVVLSMRQLEAYEHVAHSKSKEVWNYCITNYGKEAHAPISLDK
ncbi:protein DOWN-REGULATED IN DIF1 11-like [Carica papaya]|uniref:protein DOWN-REGULATED IN DIF1 11-like n=1 Tax=Carica papaya TaxID=3649 RepID=UPI000B8C7E76|nr:protein DOWN-REGULATED IN DIF1 11-like [Carica papaya]